jgi:hypothetical protein
MSMIALEAGASSHHLFATNRAGPALSYCANYAFGVCNWVGPAGADGTYCLACSLNRTIPNLSEFGSLGAWHQCEKAKKRLVYALLRGRSTPSRRAEVGSHSISPATSRPGISTE